MTQSSFPTTSSTSSSSEGKGKILQVIGPVVDVEFPDGKSELPRRWRVKRTKIFTDGHPVDWTILDDPGAQASVAFGTSGQPETFVISPSGIVAGIQKGPSSYEDLEQMLARARAVG